MHPIDNLPQNKTHIPGTVEVQSTQGPRRPGNLWNCSIRLSKHILLPIWCLLGFGQRIGILLQLKTDIYCNTEIQGWQGIQLYRKEFAKEFSARIFQYVTAWCLTWNQGDNEELEVLQVLCASQKTEDLSNLCILGGRGQGLTSYVTPLCQLLYIFTMYLFFTTDCPVVFIISIL